MNTSVPGQRVPAPTPLRLVQEFVNTTWLRTGEDELADTATFESWLGARGLLPEEGVVLADLDLARGIRAALRALIAGEAERQSSAALSTVMLRPAVDEQRGLVLAPVASGVAGVLAQIVVAVLDSQRHGLWTRLKLCPAVDCRWAFYDPSRNSSAVWCNMAVCGARAKARTYYRRRRGQAAG